ncbi:MAG: A/G-specific adenine glycosylase [Candidatus Sulfotelmatobacter sp.]|jgi:A/G-specific adenine glycosylase
MAGPNSFRSRLLAWYDTHARKLPWRAPPQAKKSRDPYRVWLSEIMLQQTRVAAVIEHYREFLRRFPTVEKLASARQASVLAAWSGLGYYRRARMLHGAAKVIVRKLGGQFPATAEEWQALPGIGRYTAAAVASIVFGEAVAVVDGNVERVLQRVSGQRLAGQELWRAAEHLLDPARPGDFNQAMMELGATVCTPRAPACLTCPVVKLCATRGEMPRSKKAPRQKKREIHYALCQTKNGQGSCGDGRPRKPALSDPEHSEGESNGSGGPDVSGRSFGERAVFLVQRPPDARLMAGMWELPEIAQPQNHCKPAFTLRHSITVTDHTVRVWRPPAPPSASGEWILSSRLGRVPLTGLARKILYKAGVIASKEPKLVD